MGFGLVLEGLLLLLRCRRLLVGCGGGRGAGRWCRRRCALDEAAVARRCFLEQELGFCDELAQALVVGPFLGNTVSATLLMPNDVEGLVVPVAWDHMGTPAGPLCAGPEQSFLRAAWEAAVVF